MIQENPEAGFVNIDDFSGGMNTQDSPIALENNQAQIMLNAVLTKKGGISVRNGYGKYSSSAFPTSAGAWTYRSTWEIIRYYTPSFSITVAAVRYYDATRLFWYDEDAGSVTYGTWVELTTTAPIAATNRVSFCIYRDILFVFNGLDVLKYWDGNTTTSALTDCGFKAGTLTVYPKLMKVCDDRLFMVGYADGVYSRTSVFYTNFDAWSGAVPTELEFENNNEIVLKDRISDKRGITALYTSALNDELLVTVEFGTYELIGTDEDNYEFKKISNEAGCVSQNGMTTTPYETIIMVGVNEVYEITDSGFNPIATQIKKKLQERVLTECCVEYDKDTDSVIIAAGPTGDGELVYNARTGGWTEWSIGIDTIHRFKYSGDDERLIFVKTSTNNVYTFDSAYDDDDGTAFNFKLKTKAFQVDGFAPTKTIRTIKAIYDSTHDNATELPFDLTISINNGDTIVSIRDTVKGTRWNNFKWNQAAWAAGTLMIGSSSVQLNPGNIVVFTIEKTNDNKLTLYGLAVNAKLLSGRFEEG